MTSFHLKRGLLWAFALLLLQFTAARAQYYYVSGHVTDSHGVGIWNVNLDIFDSETGDLINVPGDHTDQNGYYIVFLFTGTYDIEYNAPPGERLVSEVRRNIVVQSDITVDVVLEDGFFLSGRVTDSQGAGIYQLDIDVDDAVTGERILTPHDKTDTNGDYQVVVPPGLFDLTYQPPPGSRSVAVTIPGATIHADTTVDVSLEDGFFVSGWVVDEAGAPLSGIDLDADDLETGQRINTPRDNTDDAGHYEIVIPPGTFKIIFDPLLRTDLAPAMLDTVVITADTVLDTVTLLNGVWLSGQVTDGQGGPVVGAYLDVFDSATERFVITLRNKSDSTGTYGVSVPPGVYDLVMHPPEGSALGEGSYTSVSVLGDTTVDFVLGPAGIGDEGAGGGASIPSGFVLFQNCPNPFNPQTTIRYRLPETGPASGAEAEPPRPDRARLEVFDLRGRLVRRLVDRVLGAGDHQVVWDGRDDRGGAVASGVYLYRLRYGSYTLSRKLVIQK